MYIDRKDSINVPFSVITNKKTAEQEEALLDSGATHNFMDKRMAKRLGIGTKDLGASRAIRNVDGTPNVGGELTR
jgi:predicted aspartyl protease